MSSRVIGLFFLIGLIGMWVVMNVQGNAAPSGSDFQQSLSLIMRAPNTPTATATLPPTNTPIATATPPSTPVPPPAGTYGLLTEGNRLYRVEAEGENLTLLAEYGTTRITRAEWSSNGTSFVVVTPRANSIHYFTFDLYRRDGTLVQTRDFVYLSSLRWSPDGRWLFYLVSDGTSEPSLSQRDTYTGEIYGRSGPYTRDYAISADSTQLAWTHNNRTTDINIAPIAPESPYTTIYDGKYVKAWLANDSRFLVLRHNGEYEETGTWHIIGGNTPVINLGPYTSISAMQPAPNGNRLAFGRDGAISVLDPATGNLLHTISGSGTETFNRIEWSPDQHHMLYESNVSVGGSTVATLSYATLDNPTPAPHRLGSSPIAGHWRDNQTISYSQLRPISSGFACDPLLYNLSDQSSRPLLPASDACWQVLDWVTVP